MTKPDTSDLEQGLDALGRTLTGVTARLLGPKSVGQSQMPEHTTLGPEADKALEDLGGKLGQVLQAAGEGLKEHPLDPVQAVKSAQEHVHEPVEAPEGWSPLVGGLSAFGSGLLKVSEGVLDAVAPRKPK